MSEDVERGVDEGGGSTALYYKIMQPSKQTVDLQTYDQLKIDQCFN